MKSISINATKLTPFVNMDAKKGLIEIEGCSITDNAVEFYKPLIEFIDKYIGSPAKKTIVNVKLEYLTIHSSKCILEIFKKLETIHKSNKSKVLVNWYYAVEDVLEAGENYKLIIKLPFKIVER
jgi:hypothetical protein